MALSFVGSASGSATGGNDVTVTLPAGTQEDDVVFLGYFVEDENDVDMAPNTSGYTELADVYRAHTVDANLGVFYKAMGASPDTSVTCPGRGSGAAGAVAVVHVWRGVDLTTPIDVTTTTDTGTGAIPDSPSITTVTDNAVVLTIGTSQRIDSAVTAPSGYINSVSTSSSDGGTIGMASKVVATAGAEDPGAWQDWDSQANRAWCAATVAIRPAAAGATTVCESGSFTLTGQDANLEHHRVTDAERGLYAYTGQDAGLEWHHLTDIGHGSYTYTGQDVTLTVGTSTPWTKVGETTFTVGTGSGTETKTLPGSILEGDIVLIGRASDGLISTASITTAGYTNEYLTSPGRLDYKVMDETPDSDVTITQIADVQAGVIQVWRGALAGSPIDGTLQSAAAGSGMPDAPSYTTQFAQSLRLALGFLDDDDAAASVTAPSGYSNLLAADTGQASTTAGATVMIASKYEATTGADNPAAFGGTGNDFNTAIHLALRLSVGVTTTVCERGSFAYTGQTADLFHNRTTDIGQGSYALSGQDVELRRALLVDALTGSYTYTGQDVALSQGRSTSIETGNFTLTGQDVDFRVAVVLQAEAGSYVLTGQAAELLYSRVLDAETGFYVLTGQDANLVVIATTCFEDVLSMMRSLPESAAGDITFVPIDVSGGIADVEAVLSAMNAQGEEASGAMSDDAINVTAVLCG